MANDKDLRPSLDALEERYREAQEEFREDRTPENKAAYKKAKADFEASRVAMRQQEEADPNNPRGQVMVAVNNQNLANDGNTVQGEVVEDGEGE